MAAEAPVVEVLIRDEVSASLERVRQRMHNVESRTLFSKWKSDIKDLEGAAQKLNTELQTLVNLTGAGAIISTGFIGGIAAAARALANFSREGLGLHYTASELGLTTEQLEKLIARGQALGLSRQQATSNIEGVVRALRPLQQEGGRSQIFRELARGRGGVQLAQELMQAVRGPGGWEAGMRVLAERMKGMSPDAQESIKKLFGLSSVTYRDMFDVGPLNENLRRDTPTMRAYQLAWTNLGITFDNLKTTVGMAVMPAFERLTHSLDRWLQGPGRDVVNAFAEWARSINIDWDAIANGLTAALQTLKKIFDDVKAAFAALDPIVQQIGGWKPIIEGVVALGFSSWLFGVAGGLGAIGKLMFVFGALTAFGVALSTSAKGAEAKEGGGAPAAPPAGEGGGETPQPASTGEGERPPPMTILRSSTLGQTTPYRFTGSSESAAAYGDRRVMKELDEVVDKTTDELKRLNDYLGLGEEAEARAIGGGFGFGGIGGGRAGGGGGMGGGGGRTRFPRGGRVSPTGGPLETSEPLVPTSPAEAEEATTPRNMQPFTLEHIKRGDRGPPGATPVDLGDISDLGQVRDITGRSTRQFPQFKINPQAVIVHNTGGPSLLSAVNTMNQRGLGYNFIVDRDGTIYQFIGTGRRGAHILPGWGPMGSGLSNANTIGISGAGKEDKNFTPAQIAAMRKLAVFLGKKYGIPPSRFFGHGEVNPGHRDKEEGTSVTRWTRGLRSWDDVQPGPSSQQRARPTGRVEIGDLDIGGQKSAAPSWLQSVTPSDSEAVDLGKATNRAREQVTSMLARPRSRMGLKVNIRAPSGTTVKTESEGGFQGNTTVSREKTPAEPANAEE